MWEHVRSMKSAGYIAPKLSPDAFLATIWTLTTFSFLFLPARLYARWKSFQGFYSDDYLVILAWTLSLAITVSLTALNPTTYQMIHIGAGVRPLPPNVNTLVMRFSRLFFTVSVLLYIGLWSVKLAFLLFFKRLGTRSARSSQRWWWCVLGITVVAFAVCFVMLPYRCCLVSYEVLRSPECETQGWSFVSMKVNCALDVFTDCLIMSIPFLLLRHARISRRQKIALSGIFSLVVFTIIIAIVRATLTIIRVDQQMDPIWIYLWTSIELNVAIIIACIAPYRTLFLRERNSVPSPLFSRIRQDFKGRALKLSTLTREEEVSTSPESSSVAPWVDEGRGDGCSASRPFGVSAKTISECPRLGVIPSVSDSIDCIPFSEREELREVQKHVKSTIPKSYVQ